MNTKRLDTLRRVTSQRQRDIIVVLEDIHDPHNAAAILRTCDGMGIQNVYFIFEKEKRFNPKRVGKASSSSANKWLDFEIFTSTEECIRKLKQENYTVLATAFADTSESLDIATFPEERVAILVGNEHGGLSERAITLADRVIQIPMHGFVQSLNVSVATAIILWEITKQRTTSGKNWKLNSKEQKILFENFLKRAKK